jgi:putative RecB family exonuclease
MTSFSYSKINAFLNCPRAYEFRYLEKERERFSTIERHMGTTVHEALRWAYQQRLDGNEPEPAAVVDRYDALWWTDPLQSAVVVKNGVTEEDYRLDGRSMVEGFLGRYFHDDDSLTLGLEQRFRVELREDLRFSGIIDRLARRPDGPLRIIDYKTGKRVPDPGSDPQLAYYAMHVFETFPDETVELAYVDLRNGRELVRNYGRDRIEADRGLLLGKIDEICAAEKFEPNPSILCKWCGFSPICDAATPGAASVVAKLTGAPPAEPSAASSTYCPECGGTLRERNGRYGSFIGCSGYPNCRYTRDRW